MASFLSGLGQGLGAIGAGVSRGELLGTQQTERLRQQKAMQDYRTALLAAQAEKAKQTASGQDERLKQQRRAPYQRALADANLYSFFHDPQNKPILDEYETRAGYRGIDPESLPPDPNYNPTTGEVRIPGTGLGAGAGLGGGGATPPPAGGPGLGGGATTAPPPPPPPPPPSGPPPMQPLAPINPILERARMQGVAPGVISPPRSAAGPPIPGGQRMFSPSPGTQIPLPPEPAAPAPPPPTETVAPSTTTTTAPEQPEQTPFQIWAADYHKGPQPGESPRNFLARKRKDAAEMGMDLKVAMAAAQIPALNARAGRDVAEGGLATIKATNEPAESASRIAERGARTENLGEQTRVSRLMTPLKAANVVSEMQRRNDQTAQAKATLEKDWAALREKTANDTASLAERKRLNDSTISYHNAEKAKIDFAIKHGDKMAPEDKAALALYSKGYFGGHLNPASQMWEANLPAPQRSQNRALMNGILAKYQLPPVADPWDAGAEASAATAKEAFTKAGAPPAAGGAKTAPAGGGSTMGPTHGSVSAAPAAVSRKHLSDMKAMIAGSRKPGGRSMRDWLKTITNPADQETFKAAYQRVTKKAWAG